MSGPGVSMALAGRLVPLTAQQNITLLDDLLVRRRLILRCKFVGRNHSADLVNGAVQPSTGNESGQIPIHKRLADPKRPTHSLHGERSVRLEKLSVCFDPHLSDIISRMRG